MYTDTDYYCLITFLNWHTMGQNLLCNLEFVIWYLVIKRAAFEVWRMTGKYFRVFFRGILNKSFWWLLDMDVNGVIIFDIFNKMYWQASETIPAIHTHRLDSLVLYTFYKLSKISVFQTNQLRNDNIFIIGLWK